MKVKFLLEEGFIESHFESTGELLPAYQEGEIDPKALSQSQRARLWAAVTRGELDFKAFRITLRNYRKGDALPSTGTYKFSSVDPLNVCRAMATVLAEQECWLHRQQVQYAEQMEVNAGNVVQLQETAANWCHLAAEIAARKIEAGMAQLRKNTEKQRDEAKGQIPAKGGFQLNAWDFKAFPELNQWRENWNALAAATQRAKEAAAVRWKESRLEDVKEWALAHGDAYVKTLIEKEYYWQEEGMSQMLSAIFGGGGVPAEWEEWSSKPSREMIARIGTLPDEYPDWVKVSPCHTDRGEAVEVEGRIGKYVVTKYFLV